MHGATGDLVDARAHLGLLAKRAKRRTSVQLPISFVRVTSGGAPLARLLGEGRSGEVRLKLFLTYVMRATAKPYGTPALYTYDAARALGLADPDGSGGRRVQAAVRWLKREGFLADGKDSRGRKEVQVLDPMARSSSPWPGRGDGSRYVSVPIELWTNGWICVLSGRAVALYVVLKELTGGRGGRNWVDPTRKSAYGLSTSTWNRAVADLVDAGLLKVQVELVRDDYAVKRKRSTYTLDDDRMRLTPAPGTA